MFFIFSEEANYYEPVRLSNFWNNRYIECGSNGDRNKALSVKEYLNRIRPYLKNIINNIKKSDIRKTIANNFISSTDNNEEHVMPSKDVNIKVMINDKANKVIKELFDSLKNRFQNNLESMKGGDFVFDYVHLLYYKCHKRNSSNGVSYTDPPDWKKNKSNNNKFYQEKR